MRTRFSPSLLFALFLALPVFCQTTPQIITAYDGKPPYSKEQLIEILKLKALPKAEIETAVVNRGISVRMTPEVTAQLQKAGAWPDLINELNISYRPVAASKIEGSDFDGYSPFCSSVPRISSQELIELFRSPLGRSVIVNMVHSFGFEQPKDGAGQYQPLFVRGNPLLRDFNVTDADAAAITVANNSPRPASQGFTCSFADLSDNRTRDITLETYKTVRIGMSTIEVRRIFSWPTGREGIYRSSGYLFQGFTWYSSHLGGLVHALFRNEQLVSLYCDKPIPAEVQPVPSRAPVYDARLAAQAQQAPARPIGGSPRLPGSQGGSSAGGSGGGSNALPFESDPGKPITEATLVGALGLHKFTTRDLVTKIRERGVDFQVTDEVEEQLKNAGASGGVIQACEENYRDPLHPAAGSEANRSSSASAPQAASPPVVSEAEKRARKAGVPPPPSAPPILGRWVFDVVLLDPNGVGPLAQGPKRSLRVHVQLDLSVVTEGFRQGQLGGQITIDGTSRPLDTARFEYNVHLETTSREDGKSVIIIADMKGSQLQGNIAMPVGQEYWRGDFVARKMQ